MAESMTLRGVKPISHIARDMILAGAPQAEIEAALAGRTTRERMLVTISRARREAGAPRRRAGGYHPDSLVSFCNHVRYIVEPRDVPPLPKKHVTFYDGAPQTPDMGEPLPGRSAYDKGARPGDGLVRERRA